MNEKESIEILRLLGAFSEHPDAAADSVVTIAAQIVPQACAVLTFLDGTRALIKAYAGHGRLVTASAPTPIPLSRVIPRRDTICDQVVGSKTPLEVTDTSQDPRFFDNPYVVQGIRSYIGFPLTLESGLTVGTLCLVATQTVTMVEDQREALGALARLIIAAFDNHLALIHKLQETKRLAVDSRRAQAKLRKLTEELDRAHAELKVSERSAREATRLKSEFLATMSHEIRTPMNGVIGMAGILLDTKLSEGQRSYVHAIKSSGESLMAIINDILDFSKIEAGKMTLETVDINLAQALSDVEELLQISARAKGVQLSTHLAPDVPRVIKGDSGRLRQIVINLVGNAIKFTPQGRVTLQVTRLPNRVANFGLHFAVTDTGIGIPQDLQKKLFSSFTQGRADANRQYGGTGLGLAICKRLVGLMGGEIGFDSVEGQGSTFWFTLFPPLSPAGPESLTSAQTLAETIPSFKDVRILLAEDNQVNQTVALKMLERLGCRADAVANGKEVLEALARLPYDAILMDCQMPELDGFETTRQIRQREQTNGKKRHTIIAMTANAMQGDDKRCLESGMDDYLSKPVSIQKFAEILGKWLPRSGTPKRK